MAVVTENGHINDEDLQSHKPILIVVMGVAGTGKTTLAKALNAELKMPYVEGDDLHPKSNIDKMSSGHPLTDADREPWLELIRTTVEHKIVEQETDPEYTSRRGVMVTCSSLKKYYRDILRGAYKPGKVPEHLDPVAPETMPTYFVYIKEEVDLLKQRIAGREGHFMKAGMLDSQMKTLESPEGEEGVVVVPLDATTEEQVKIALQQLRALAGPM